MSFASDIETEVKRIFAAGWTVTKTKEVPEPSSLALESNDAKELDPGTVLYADLSGSTTMVRDKTPKFAAEVYRAFLYSAAQIIRSENGVVTAYDGDRVMALFVGSTPCTNAARCGLKINRAVTEVINPAITAQYGSGTYTVKHVVGIDRSSLFVARTGVRGDNDLVWVGRAANYAAKLTELSPEYPTYITAAVFDQMNDSAKYGGNDNRLMWTKLRWTQMSDMTVYGSGWRWAL
jgi:class 3 adenylate cyclase